MSYYIDRPIAVSEGFNEQDWQLHDAYVILTNTLAEAGLSQDESKILHQKCIFELVCNIIIDVGF